MASKPSNYEYSTLPYEIQRLNDASYDRTMVTTIPVATMIVVSDHVPLIIEHGGMAMVTQRVEANSSLLVYDTSMKTMPVESSCAHLCVSTQSTTTPVIWQQV